MFVCLVFVIYQEINVIETRNETVQALQNCILLPQTRNLLQTEDSSVDVGVRVTYPKDNLYNFVLILEHHLCHFSVLSECPLHCSNLSVG